MRMRPRRARRQARRLSRSLFGSLAVGMMLGGDALQALGQANSLMAAGDFDEAANLFGQLADGLEERGLPKRAANLHASAALAQIQAGEPAQALERARRGIRLLELAGRPRHARRMAERLAEALQARGYAQEAASLLGGNLPAPETARPEEAQPARRGTLPAKCPHCGGAVRSDDVDWIDAMSAECAFCGGVIKAT